MMRGFTLIELMVTMVVLSILLAIAIPNLRSMNEPLDDAAQQIAAVIKQSRLKAMSNTMSLRVRPLSATQLKVESANNCGSATWASEAPFDRTLPGGILFKATTWSVCFDGRGLANNSAIIDLQRQKDGLERRIEILLGGAVVGP